jgi:hypothetical protein
MQVWASLISWAEKKGKQDKTVDDSPTKEGHQHVDVCCLSMFCIGHEKAMNYECEELVLILI